MRKDYEYVDKATDLILATTDKGDKVVEEISDKRISDGSITGTEDMLISLQNDYCIMEVNSDMVGWFKEFVEDYTHHFGAKPPIIWCEFVQAFTEGLVTIKKVVWD